MTTDELVQRATERANIHALYAGAKYGNNIENKLGMQAKAAYGKAVAKLPAATDCESMTGAAKQSCFEEKYRSSITTGSSGFSPTLEDFNYFVERAGGASVLLDPTYGKTVDPSMRTTVKTQSSVAYRTGETATLNDYSSVDYQLRDIAGWCSDGKLYEDLGDQEPTVAGEPQNYDVYTCYFPGNLILDANAPWYVETDTKGGNNGGSGANGGLAESSKGRKYTFFVQGNLLLKGVDATVAGLGSERLNDAVTAVDIGSFLGFIVKSNIIMDANVGVVMPNPKTNPELVSSCWEGQNATLNPNFYKFNGAANSLLSDKDRNNGYQGDSKFRSAAGSVEGVFIADGNIVIQRFEKGEACNPVNLSDRRFIGQGIFAVWGTSNFLRDFNQRDRGCQDDTHGVYDNRVPTETFIYRPDLVRNLPYWMRRVTVEYTDITGGRG